MTKDKNMKKAPQEKDLMTHSEISEGDVIDVDAKELVPASSDQFLPTLTVDQALQRYEDMKRFVGKCLVVGKDYGRIPGTKKDTLYKPGAEKLTTFFGLRVTFDDAGSVERWDESDPFFHYQRICQLWKGDVLIASASGSANSKEGRYRWRWVKPYDLPPDTDIDTLKKRGGKEGIFEWQYEKRPTTGQYAKPQAYWENIDKHIAEGTIVKRDEAQPWDGAINMYLEWEAYEYRIPNDDVYTLVNTILKMAEKRALVAATLIGCNASDYFTQDMEDMVPGVETNGFSIQDEVVKENADPQTFIQNARSMIAVGTFGGNDWLVLIKGLGTIEKDFAFEIKKKHEVYDGNKLVRTDFAAAAEELIAEYEKING